MVNQANPSDPVAVIGTTTWGTTLALLLARRGVPVRLWARSDDEAARLRQDGEHKLRLPGHPFPPAMAVTSSLADALRDAGAVIFAVPSETLRENARLLASHSSGSPVIVSACKGLEQGTLDRMSQVLAQELPNSMVDGICALSGPNLAREIVSGIPASTVVASASRHAAEAAQRLLNSPVFRVYTNADVVGVELAGALKNIVAIGAGICDGLQFGNNAKAALVTRGLAEITRLGLAAGAGPLTFSGLAGLGDLIATCYSSLSRNRMVGERIAQGRTLREAVVSLGGEVAEGVTTTPAAVAMAHQLGVEMPIAETARRVLFEGLSPKQAALELMGRPPRPE